MIQISTAKSQEILQLLRQANHIVIISHRNPDPDTIGSNLALHKILQYSKKNVVSACIDPVKSSIIVPEYVFQTSFDPTQADLIICVDAGSISQIGFIQNFPDLLNGEIPVLNIDHHASNNLYGSHHLVFPEAASTSLVIYNLLKAWGWKISPTIATYLLYGLYYDTGSFMNSNTTAEVYDAGADLMKNGADISTIVREVFKQHSLGKLKLWGKIFEQAELTEKNIVVAGIKHEDIKKKGLESSDLSGAIDYLSMVKNNNFAIILSEDGKGNVRGSIRTKENNIDLSQIAGLFGGGGHKKASGFSISGKLDQEVRWNIKPADENSKVQNVNKI